MKRTYITHVTRDYLEVAINLANSLNFFSKIPLIVYCIGLEESDKEKFNGFKNVQLRNIDLDIEESKSNDYTINDSGNFYINRYSNRIYKILSAKTIAMQMALEEGWQEVCYLDSDCIATPVVDELFDWLPIISNFPIGTEGIHEYMIIIENGRQKGNPFEFSWPIPDNKLTLEWPLMNFMQMTPEQRGRYRTTGIMLMNQNCLPFIKTWKDLCFVLPKLVDTNYYAAFHEETIYNVLSWKKENKGFPLCYINIGEGLETVKHFYSNESKEGNLRWSDTDTSQNFYKIPDDKKYVKVLHGEKRSSEVNKILDFLSNNEEEIESKILIQIDTFPDTIDKIEITKLCIESLRPLGYPILLTSHIDIPDELKILCDFTYSDNLNVLLPKTGDINYFYYGNDNINMNFRIEDIDSHSPAVISGWINGAKFSKENGFTHFLKVEYDFILDISNLDKLKSSIVNSSNRDGFVMVNNNYVVPRCIFTKADIIIDKNISISSPDDYYKVCDKYGVPNEIRRMAGVLSYYILINNLKNMNVYPSEGENYFKCSIPDELKRSFPGFLAPLISNDNDVYICSYGMSNDKNTSYTLYEDDVLIEEDFVNTINGSFTYKKVNINKTSKYKLIWHLPEKSEKYFTYDDVYQKKYGTINIYD